MSPQDGHYFRSSNGGNASTCSVCGRDYVGHLVHPDAAVGHPDVFTMPGAALQESTDSGRIDCSALGAVALGAKHDGGKPRYDLLPAVAVDQVVAVLTFGAKRYAPDNWRHVEGWRWRYHAAALRHLFAWARGQRLDPDSGLPHLAHAVCSLLFLAELDSGGVE